MQLIPLGQHDIPMVSDWFARSDYLQWLDFGNGKRALDPVTLKIMSARNCHFLRMFRPEGEAQPVGLVAFSQIEPAQRTGQLWYVLGNPGLTGRGYTTEAVSALLRIGFTELGLGVVRAWAVEQNLASIRVLQKNGFRCGGRLRQCHRIEGLAYDRLNFDLLASEYLPHSEKLLVSSAPFTETDVL